MSKPLDVAAAAKLTGTFLLLPPDTILDMYERAGKNPDSDREEDAPDYVENVDGVNYLFTGWTVRKGAEEFEFVVRLGDSFTADELDSIDFMQPDEDEDLEE